MRESGRACAAAKGLDLLCSRSGKSTITVGGKERQGTDGGPISRGSPRLPLN